MEKKCHVCENVTNNKKYCSLKCRYSDSHFKKFTWNTKENLENNAINTEKWEKSYKKAHATLKENYRSGKIKVWNDGLTKDDHPSLKKISENVKGDKNFIFKVLNNPEKLEKYKKNLSNALKNTKKSRKGKTFEECFGVKKSIDYKNSLSKSAKLREIHGHTGKKHSEESKRKMSEATSKRISEGKFNVFTVPIKKFLLILKEINLENLFQLEYHLKYYSIDFASPTLKLAIEIDGDFWHCNPKFYPNGPKYKSQIKNLNIQKRKDKYIESKGWKILRFWEDEINNNKEKIKKEILNEINKINS